MICAGAGPHSPSRFRNAFSWPPSASSRTSHRDTSRRDTLLHATKQNARLGPARRRYRRADTGVPNGGSRACGVTLTATFGDGVAVAVMAWHDCVRAFESGGLPACTTIAGRARSAAEAVDRAGRAAPRRRRWAGCILGGKAPGHRSTIHAHCAAPQPRQSTDCTGGQASALPELIRAVAQRLIRVAATGRGQRADRPVPRAITGPCQ